MLVNQEMPVYLQAGQWLILLGWIEAHRKEGEAAMFTDIIAAIGKQLKP